MGAAASATATEEPRTPKKNLYNAIRRRSMKREAKDSIQHMKESTKNNLRMNVSEEERDATLFAKGKKSFMDKSDREEGDDGEEDENVPMQPQEQTRDIAVPPPPPRPQPEEQREGEGEEGGAKEGPPTAPPSKALSVPPPPPPLPSEDAVHPMASPSPPGPKETITTDHPTVPEAVSYYELRKEAEREKENDFCFYNNRRKQSSPRLSLNTGDQVADAAAAAASANAEKGTDEALAKAEEEAHGLSTSSAAEQREEQLEQENAVAANAVPQAV